MTLYTGIQNLADFGYQAFVVFPYSALTIPRINKKHLTAGDKVQPTAKGDSNNQSNHEKLEKAETMPHLSEKLVAMCTSLDSVSALLAEDPSMPPGDAWKKLYGGVAKAAASEAEADVKEKGVNSLKDAITQGKLSPEEMEKATKCGKWGNKTPSDLFLTIYHDALGAVDGHPEQAMVSPSLMGSNGTVPLTVISTVPDIVRHMSNLIVRAEREVFLATNYWENGVAAKFITNAMKELSRRAGERGERIVMKILYDRGSPKQLVEPHYLVSEKEWTGAAVGIPFKREIPNIDLQVMNYHRPMLGTFHAKYMVVDRKMAVLQSNNIQDNDNLELMVHLEGDIVDSLYDMALLSWHKKLEPPLPSHASPAVRGGLDGGKTEAAHPAAAVPPTGHPALSATGGKEDEQKAEADMSTRVAGPPSIDQTGAPQPPGGKIDAFLGCGGPSPAQGPEESSPAVPLAEPLPEHTTDTPHYDATVADEVRRVTAAVSPSGDGSEGRVQAVCRHLNHTTNLGFQPDAATRPCGRADEMTPYVVSQAEGGAPVPIAMVCRAPYGSPTHRALRTPQNVAWLSALRNATESVFIQTPTLNAEPLVPAIMEACERGVDVFCYVCLGYNDSGELLPMQGGHNEMVAHHLHASLSAAGRSRLHYFWYVGKDQTKPIVAERKKRSCHIKLMIVDGRVGIAGNGNQDTQSWFHSQEINVMVDSRDVCGRWIDGLRRNQNTHLYGALDRTDGVWRDAHGNEAEAATGVDPGRFSWAKGFVGAVKRVQGTGGF